MRRDKPGSVSRVRQTKKSIATHQRIIDAAIRCFLEIGYHRTTTSEIAKRANVTRGAVQYYFPTTPEVLRATVAHIQNSILTEFGQVMRDLPDGADRLDAAVEKSWELANSPLWTVWTELLAAARTDEELRAIVYPAAEKFEVDGTTVTREALPDLAARVDADRFMFGRYLSWQMVLGVARCHLGPDAPAVKRRLIDQLKVHMHEFWEMQRSPKG